jgi:purine-binding chemotaxis protein CheW
MKKNQAVEATVDHGADAVDVAAASTTDSRQFVTFTVQGELFAVPLAEVQEIIRLPDMVGVPLSPPSLEGLANLRGAVLPVASLRRVFQMADIEHDDSTRVVVINQGVPVGFIVDRMASVITAEAHEIEGVQGIRSTVAADFLSGMIKQAAGMTMILDPAQLIKSEFAGVAKRVGGAFGDSLLGGGAARDEARQVVNDEIQLVSFVVAEQEYALPIENVQEIVQVPDQISRVPNADSHVIGVMTLRQRLLPMVSLRRMFGLTPAPLDEHNRIVVVSLDEREGRNGMSVGVVMDTVKEVLRVNRSLVDPMPALLSRGGDGGEIQSICRLASGKRLVSILSAERMFQSHDLRSQIAAHVQGDDGSENAMSDSDNRGGPVDEEEQFVVFRLAHEEYGVPIDCVQEIVRVPEELTHVPKSPDFIEGVVNLRGAVLPVVDQRRRFGLSEIERNDRQRIMVFTLNGVQTGFIVDSVSEVLKISRSVIGQAPSLSEEQSRLIHRVANVEKQKRIILLLDVNQLLNKNELGQLSHAA